MASSDETAPTSGSVVAEDAEGLDLGALFDQQAPFLVRVVTRLVGSPDRAEDVVQRAFMTAHRKGLPSREPDRARAWLYRVAMNEVRHERRSLARRVRLAAALGREPTPPSGSPDEGLTSASTAEQVRAAIRELPENQREVFVLYELEELTGAEIAELLGWPENTVWSRLRLARGRFKKVWTERERDHES